MVDRRTSCCFTGHRVIPRAEYSGLVVALDRTLEELVGHGYTDFFAGGALGFDTLAALRVIALRQKYPSLSLHLILPCRDQTLGWSGESIDIYNGIITAADSVGYVREAYRRGCMQERNRALVDSASVCVCYLNGRKKGGTAGTVKYAMASNVGIINLGREEISDGQQRLTI